MKKEEFEKKIDDNGFLEYARFVDNYYGTPRDYVEKMLSLGNDVILEIEIQGALQIKKRYPDSVLLFVMPPSAEILAKRLRGRGTETEEVIKKRLSRACEEAVGIENYDYIVINDNLEECVECVHEIICAAHFDPNRNLDFINNMREQLTKFKEL